MNMMPYIENLELLKQALTHRSFLNENNLSLDLSNQRLEFLGDAILELWIRKELFLRFTEMNEGELSQMRTQLVCSACLAEIAKNIDLGKYLILSKSEESQGGRANEKLLANTFESLVAALYLDQDYQAVNAWLLALMEPYISKIAEAKQFKDSKTILQEMAQEHFQSLPVYSVLSQEGSEHNKTFVVAVKINGKQISKGSGKSKQKAEIEASKKALKILEKRFIRNGDKQANALE
jgi:ribonuclease-3